MQQLMTQADMESEIVLKQSILRKLPKYPGVSDKKRQPPPFSMKCTDLHTDPFSRSTHLSVLMWVSSDAAVVVAAHRAEGGGHVCTHMFHSSR